MDARTPPEPVLPPAPRDGADPIPWLAWGWVALLVLSAAAVLFGWEDLRLALDVQRHLR